MAELAIICGWLAAGHRRGSRMIDLYDCIVIGAGPAELSAALFLARYRRRVLVFHHNSPRNLYSHGVHGFLGHQGILPVDLLARGRDEVRLHGGVIVEGRVTSHRTLNWL